MFYSSEDDVEDRRELEGDLRAGRGNGAETAPSAEAGRPPGRQRLLQSCDICGGHIISSLTGREGGPVDSTLVLWRNSYSTSPSLIGPFPPSLPSSLDCKTVRWNLAQRWPFTEDGSIHAPAH